MDDKREAKKKDKKLRKSRSRSRDKRRSPSRSPSYSRRRRERSRSRERIRSRERNSPDMRRRRGRRSPTPPPPPAMQVPPPPMIGNPSAAAAAAYGMESGQMYDAYGGYQPPAGAYMGDMAGYGGYDYTQGQPNDGYGTMMMGQPGPPGADYGASGWNAPPPAPVIQETEEEKRKREAAIALEVRNQRASLKKQRDDYRRRASALKRELKTLKQQRGDLSSGREPPSPTTNSFIKENDKLQSQIQSKISTIENVIDMLDGIIGKDKTPTPPPPPISGESLEHSKSPDKESKRSESSGSPERLKNKVLETMKRGKAKKDKKSGVMSESNEDLKAGKPQYNFVYYDPELHWCSVCDIFPKTAKDYLNHLHSEQHVAKVAAGSSQEYPWRDKQPQEDNPNYPDLPSKRTPIRGLQFFVPATAWYCKICDYWMGDLPSASTHLKSQKHSGNYGDFIDSHSNFEIDWMSDRQKAYEKMRDSDRQQQQASTTTRDVPDSGPGPVPAAGEKGEVDFLMGSSLQKDDGASKKKKKNKKEEKRDKKKKKRSKKKKRAASSSSSSSSSDSDTDSDKKSGKGDDFDPATSIRVAMRNILKAQEAAKDAQLVEDVTAGKWTVVQTASAPHDLTAPPPPFMTAGAETREKKRDELMISQWVTPDPIISEADKKMLENLKGKWTAVKPTIVTIDLTAPHPPFMTVEAETREKKRDELMISQWVTPEPIITEAEKKMFETLKEKLKKRDKPSPASPQQHQELGADDNRRGGDYYKRSRSKTPSWRKNSRSPGRRSGFEREGRRSPEGRRDRSRDRDLERGWRFDRRRRSRSRGRRSPAFGRGRFRTRRSYSRSRSRTRSRSRSRGRRIIEKPVVNFPPEPRPRPEKKTREKKEKKPISMAFGQKKLPFIGRMPVFKKQHQEVNKKEESVAEAMVVGENLISVENGTNLQPEDLVDVMPDPYQLVALIGAPPLSQAHPAKLDESMLPPGIDESEAYLAPKPISDAPIPRKGPLPKDFQEALDIIFDGDKQNSGETIAQKTKQSEPLPVEPVKTILDTDQPQMILPEAIEIYNQQNAAQYSTVVVSGAIISYDSQLPNAYSPGDITTSNDGSCELLQAAPSSEIDNEETRRKRVELEELAMLGIDLDDMVAQIF